MFINYHGSHSQGNIILQDIITIFQDKSIQDLKVIYQYMSKKVYPIYSLYDRLLTFLWYSLLLTPSICLTHPLLFKF